MEKEITDPRSCFNKAKLRERIFVILARDVAAIETVREWMLTRIEKGKNVNDDPQIKEAKEWIQDLIDNPNCTCTDWIEDQERKGHCAWCAKPLSFKG
jgi:hypothetical protein